MNYYAITGLINFVTTFFIFFYLLIKNFNNPQVRPFSFLSLAVAQWSLFYALWILAPNLQLANLFMRTCMIGVIFMPTFFFEFVLKLIHSKKFIWLQRSNYIFSVILSPLVYTDAYANFGTKYRDFQYWLEPNILFYITLLHFCGIVILAHFLLYFKIKESTSYLRNQLLYFFIGSIIGFGAGSTNYFYWFRIPIPPVLNIFASLYVLFTAFAIIKYKLFDIELFLKRSIGILGYIFISLIVSLPVVVLLIQHINDSLILALSIILFFIIFTPLFTMIKIRSELTLEQLLFKKRYDYRKNIKEIGQAIERKLKMKDLLDFITNNLSISLDTKNVAILINKNDDFLPITQMGYSNNGMLYINKNSSLIKLLNFEHKIINRYNISTDNNLSFDEIIKILNGLNSDIVIPIFSDNQLKAICLLGSRSYQYEYTNEDIDALEAFSHQLSIALDNAKAYKEIEDLNKNLEKKVQQRSDQLIQVKKLASIGQLVAGIAHHINNKINPPIQASAIIKRNIDAMIKENQLKPSEDLQIINDCLGIIKSDLGVVKTIVNDLLISSHHASLQFKFTDLDLNKILKTVVRIIRTDCLDRVCVHEEYDDTLPPIRADITRLEDVFMNLIKNSLDAIPEKGNIWIKSWQDDSHVFVSVKDDGIGIAEEYMDKIFDFFFTTKDIGNGTGLGLSVSYATIKEHQGDINVNSKPGHGTEFVIQLPKMLTEKEKNL